MDTWRPSKGQVGSDRMLGLRQVDQIGASGHPEQAAVLSLTTLFFRDT
jgi:hypothetical protein